MGPSGPLVPSCDATVAKLKNLTAGITKPDRYIWIINIKWGGQGRLDEFT